MKNFFKTFFCVLYLFFLPFLVEGQCFVPDSTFTNNITVNSADVNWNSAANVDYYRISYRETGQGSWVFATNPINISFASNSVTINSLNDNTDYEWRIKTWCLDGSTSNWSTSNFFTTISLFPLDCNGDQNGGAFIDNCGNCVGGNTSEDPCISFSPDVSFLLSSQVSSDTSDIQIDISQDANEPDIATTFMISSAGHFDFSTLSINDIIGYGNGMIGGGFLNANYTVFVDFIINSNKIIARAVSDSTGDVLANIDLENLSSGGVKILTSAPADTNNTTAGMHQSVTITNLFVNPSSPQIVNFDFNLTSELFDSFQEIISLTIQDLDCNGDLGGGAYIDSCGNCVAGNTGNVPCIPFTPTLSVSLSNTDCNNISSITFTSSQDANEPDMSTFLFTTSDGYFDFSSLNIGQNVGTLSLLAAGGDISFTANLIVGLILPTNQVIVYAIDVSNGNNVGSVTLSNTNPGISVVANASYNDGNNITAGNTSTVFLDNIFVKNPSSLA